MKLLLAVPVFPSPVSDHETDAIVTGVVPDNPTGAAMPDIAAALRPHAGFRKTLSR